MEANKPLRVDQIAFSVESIAESRNDVQIVALSSCSFEYMDGLDSNITPKI